MFSQNRSEFSQNTFSLGHTTNFTQKSLYTKLNLIGTLIGTVLIAARVKSLKGNIPAC